MSQSWVAAWVYVVIFGGIALLCSIGAVAEGHSVWNLLWVPATAGLILLIELIRPSFWYGAAKHDN